MFPCGAEPDRMAPDATAGLIHHYEHSELIDQILTYEHSELIDQILTIPIEIWEISENDMAAIDAPLWPSQEHMYV